MDHKAAIGVDYLILKDPTWYFNLSDVIGIAGTFLYSERVFMRSMIVFSTMAFPGMRRSA
jgi:hypothetical protein